MIVEKNNNIIIINFEKKIDYKIYNQFEKIQCLDFSKTNLIYVDFSETNFISLSGAVFIIYFLHHIKTIINYSECRIINMEERIANILAKYGFFRCAITYCNLRLDTISEAINKKYLNILKLDRIRPEISIYWPIRTIPFNSGYDFDSNNAPFFNDFINYFDLLISNNKITSHEVVLEVV